MKPNSYTVNRAMSEANVRWPWCEYPNRYQLFVDGKPHGPVQDSFYDAVHDALDEGFASPGVRGHIYLHDGAEIKTLTHGQPVN